MLAELLVTLCAAAPVIGPAPKWKAPEPVTSTVAGVKVVVATQKALPLVTARVVVQAGSELDPAAAPGTACATAMMLEEGGAGKRSADEVSDAFAAIGAELELDCDSGAVDLSVTVLERDLPRALELLADLVARPQFAEATFGPARDRAIADLVKERDDPRLASAMAFLPLVFGDHPYGHYAKGTPASLQKLTLADVQAFHKERYGPANVTVVLAGAVTSERAGELVKQAFGGWTSKAKAPAAVEPPKANGPRVVIVDKPGAPQTQVRLGFASVPRSSPDYAAAVLLDTVLGGSFTSRLVQNLREKHGYTYGIGAFHQFRRSGSQFEIASGLRTDATGAGLKEIFAELAGIKTVTAAELGKAKALVRGRIVDEFAKSSNTADAIADLVALGQPVNALTGLPAQLDAVDEAGLAAAAQRLFSAETVLVLVGDRKAIEAQLQTLTPKPNVEVRELDSKL